MDQHFRALGVPRGASEEEVKKAYRAKALALHPDRNPTGADAFKRVNTAYEAIQAHYKQNGGHDSVHTRPAGGFQSSGAGYRHARATATGSTSPPAGPSGSDFQSTTPPRFTDEELFGQVPGGWSKPSSDPINSGYMKANPFYAAADARWRNAHGSRVPVSGYTGVKVGAAAPGSTGVPEYRKDEPNFRVPPFSSTPRTYEELKFMLEQLYAKTDYVREIFHTSVNPTRPQPTASQREAFELAKEKKMRHVWERLNSLTQDDDKRAALRSEWEQIEDELKAKLTAARCEAEMEMQQREREEARKVAMAEERRRLQAVEEAARRVREERNLKAKELAEQIAAELRREKDDLHQDNLLDDKRRLLKMMFRLQYTPDPADVGDMTDVEVFTLTELMEDINQKMKLVLEARMKKGSCSRCRVQPKDQQVRPFQCSHAAVCSDCSARASQCPLCGARRVTPKPTPAPGSTLKKDESTGVTSSPPARENPPPPRPGANPSADTSGSSSPASALSPTARTKGSPMVQQLRENLFRNASSPTPVAK